MTHPAHPMIAHRVVLDLDDVEQIAVAGRRLSARPARPRHHRLRHQRLHGRRRRARDRGARRDRCRRRRPRGAVPRGRRRRHVRARRQTGRGAARRARVRARHGHAPRRARHRDGTRSSCSAAARRRPAASPFEHWFVAEPAYAAGRYARGRAARRRPASPSTRAIPRMHYQLACYVAARRPARRGARAPAGRRSTATRRWRAYAARDADLARSATGPTGRSEPRAGGDGRWYPAGLDAEGSPRRAEPRAAQGSRGHRGRRADRGGRRFRQDPRAHPPDRAPGARSRRRAVPDPRDHVHQPGRAGDAGARRRAARRPQPRHVGDDVPRRLRPHPARRGGADRVPAGLHDLRPGRPDPGRQGRARGRARQGPEAVPAARHPRPHLRREEPADRARPVRERGVGFFDEIVAEVYTAYQRRLQLAGRDGLRRPPDARRRPARDGARRAREVAGAVPPRDGRRVPGHEPRPVPAGARAGRHARQRLRGRRLRPVDLLVARRRHPQHPRLLEGLPERRR